MLSTVSRILHIVEYAEDFWERWDVKVTAEYSAGQFPDVLLKSGGKLLLILQNTNPKNACKILEGLIAIPS